MFTRKLLGLFPLFLLTLFFRSADHIMNTGTEGNLSWFSPPAQPFHASLAQSAPLLQTRQCHLDACMQACEEDRMWGSEANATGYVTGGNLAGCNDQEVIQKLHETFEYVATFGFETAAIMNCAQFEAAYISSCTNTCNANACNYGPNLRSELSSDLSTVELSNDHSSAPFDSMAITGGFTVTESIQYENWNEAIPVAQYEMTSLSYPRLYNWTTNAAPNCTDGSLLCQAEQTLADYPLTQEIGIDPNQGVYNLEYMITNHHGNLDSDPASGYVLLLNNEDSITLEPGWRGIVYTLEDTDWDGNWNNKKIEEWNSYAGPVTITNNECHHWCWWSGEPSVNRDTYVIALDGPCDSVLLGTYTVKVAAPLYHDININDNSDEGTYSVDSIPAGCGADLDSAPVVDTNVGDHSYAFDREFIQYYKVNVPANASLLEVILEGPNSSDPNDNLDLFLRHASVPESTRRGPVTYDYASQDDVGYPDKIRVPAPQAGDWYIEVYHSNLLYTNDYHLKINIETTPPPVKDLFEGHFQETFASGQTSQVFRVPYLSGMTGMAVTFTPPLTGVLSYKVYMCPQNIPHINYEHSATLNSICMGSAGINFNWQGLAHPNDFQAQVTNTGGLGYYLLVERPTSSSSANYEINMDYTWPVNQGLEKAEPNDTCGPDATTWSVGEMNFPRHGTFSSAGDADAYTFILSGTGESVEMETFLTNIPSNVTANLIVYKKAGDTYQPDPSAVSSTTLDGSPKVNFNFVYGQEYCFVAAAQSGQNQTDQYSLYLRRANFGANDEIEVEPNDYPEQASTWNNMANPMRGQWEPASDEDYFKWTAPSSGVYLVSVSPTPTVPTHYMIVFEQTGEDADTHTPNLLELNQGLNESDIYPVGLTFYAKAGTDYYFELSQEQGLPSGWYKLTLQSLPDYGTTCAGAAMLNSGSINTNTGEINNAITSRLSSSDDMDCFHIKPSTAGGSYTLALTTSPSDISPLVELFSYDPHAFDFANETRTLLAQQSFDTGDGSNGEYTLGFTPGSSIQGLTYQFPAFTYYVGYCVCISSETTSNGGGGNGQGGTGGNGTGGNGTGGSRGGQVEQEPNDTYSNANNWDVTSEMQGALDAKRDKDMYRFTAPQSGIYKITLSNVPSNIEPNLFIYRGTNSNAVASSTTAGAGGSAQVEIDANQGETFYVKVIARSASTTSNQPYTLSTEAIPDPDEPNDEWSEATPWDAFSSSIQGYFFELVTGPADLYKFTVPQSAGSVLLTVNLTDVPANVEPNMFIKNSAGSTVASNADAQAGQPISIMIDANPGETYYVSVNPQNRFQTSESLYTLSITTTPDPTEPNDTFDLATVWNYTAGPIQGYFAEAVSGPADYYRFTAPPGTSPVAMTVQLEDVPANVAPRMFIYNSQFNPVKSKTNAGKGDSISLTFDAQPGATYYVKVLPSSRLMISSQPYTLSMSGY